MVSDDIDYEVDVRDVESQRQTGKAWLVRIYQPKETGPFPPSLTCMAAHGTTAIGLIMKESIERWRPTVSWWPLSIPAAAGGGLSRFRLRCEPGCSLAQGAFGRFKGTTAVGAFGNSSGGHQVVLSALRPRHPSYSALPLPNILGSTSAWPM